MSTFAVNQEDETQNTEEEDENYEFEYEEIEPTAFVDCNVDDLPHLDPLKSSNLNLKIENDPNSTHLASINKQIRKKPETRGPPKPKKKLWSQEVEETWQEFQTYINHSATFHSKNIINFLVSNLRDKKLSVGSIVNLKARLSIAYKNYTGRCFQVDFPEVSDYCKQQCKPNHKRAYQKKKMKDWQKFLDFAGKGLDFEERDLENYFTKCKKQEKWSNSTMRQVLSSIATGFERDKNADFRVAYPHITKFINDLE